MDNLSGDIARAAGDAPIAQASPLPFMSQIALLLLTTGTGVPAKLALCEGKSTSRSPNDGNQPIAFGTHAILLPTLQTILVLGQSLVRVGIVEKGDRASLAVKLQYCNSKV